MFDDQDSGGKSKGKVFHGTQAYKQVPGYKPVASIPAKFETVLFTGPREKKGFLSDSRRFADTDSDMPGPGTYTKVANTMEYQHDSISKKGYGPMASTSKRFKSRVVYTGPGPGEYKKQAPSQADMDSYFNRAPTTAAFHKKVTPVKPLPPKEVEATPGPGAYSCTETTRMGQNLNWESAPQTYQSSFKAAPHKLILLGNPESPAPTKYSMADPWDPKSGLSRAASHSPSRAGTSSFGGRSGTTSLNQMSSIIFLEDPKEASKPPSGPGPGSYELQYFQGIKSTLDKSAGKTSANFQPPEFTDRFGAPLSKVPEDATTGDYTLSGQGEGGPKRLGSPPKGVGAPFKSQVPGRAEYDLKESAKAPGPAYYTPKLPAKKTSHHLNARKYMVV